MTFWEKLQDIGFELGMVTVMIGLIFYTIRGKNEEPTISVQEGVAQLAADSGQERPSTVPGDAVNSDVGVS